ncbi:MAG: hypothetical protein HC886_15820 [Leptolyngbyaceae cyanobacterium SM1_1_3]|nr:hypothetical protein [Leptolyngbyaceae cyanobacterium SM1_1_3]NJN02653.1 hypothetical protein [Leptolyngbyaceae cyanobacterium RM1_1_2]NJO11844.1 hypothetical protein [Leptolyngbyaceae cyanobacterium SL_1_1]
MQAAKIIQVLAFPGWIVGISYALKTGYRCWVITPDFVVLDDGENYATSHAAIAAGRFLVKSSLEREEEIDGDISR